jgi:ABC-type Mn2+/Zn2+ transport system ATPase subunit
MSDAPVLIRARDLALGYGERRVLSGVSLDVHRGEFWVFLGANGSGKTTFLRALLGIVAPLAGSLWLDPELAGRERIGFVPQRCELNPSRPTTVREFVSLGLVGTHVEARARAGRLTRALERCGLAGLERADYWSLSGGQRQRALVARALVRAPAMLALDEPMSHLDDDTAESLLGDLVAMNRTDGITLLLVTHDAAVAEAHASHVALFRDGTAIAGDRRLIGEHGAGIETAPSRASAIREPHGGDAE